jgi:amidohydrolase
MTQTSSPASSPAHAGTESSGIFAELPEILSHVTALRHDLHQHPELAYQERYTSAAVCRELTRLGIAHKAGYAGETGVVAIIPGQLGPGPCVGLRADMDALPIVEATGLSYASRHAGCMHACGHDGHTSILLGTSAVLHAARAQFAGSVKLLFQPAEEGGCGADKMVQDGALENPRVEAIFGLHGWPGLKVGTVATRPGPLLASVDGVTIRITGKGSHAAAPQDSIDPVLCGAALVQALQQIVARETEPGDAAVVTISQFHAGAGFNVIPETAELNGTIRALTPERRQQLIDSIARITQGIAAAHRCTAQIEYFGTTPPTHNTHKLADFVKRVAQKTFGVERYIPAGKPAMWGEDFAFYLQKVPGCFFMIGVQPDDRDTYPMLHNPAFDFTDAALPVGIRMFTNLAIEFLATHTSNP